MASFRPTTGHPSSAVAPGRRRSSTAESRTSGICISSHPTARPHWENDDVRKDQRGRAALWFDRGVAGVRIDSAALLFKDGALPDFDGDSAPSPHPFTDRNELHDVYRSWARACGRLRRRADPDRRALARGRGALRPLSAARRDAHRVQLRVPRLSLGGRAPSRLHRLDARGARSRGRNRDVGALESRRDETRHAVRPQGHEVRVRREDTRHAGGRRRARHAEGARGGAADAVTPGRCLRLPGEELGLPEVEDLPDEVLQDPMFFRSGGDDPGRDGCRVPLPWHGDEPPFGFSPAGAAADPWLPQPESWGAFGATRQAGEPDSMLSLYREALRIRRGRARTRRRDVPLARRARRSPRRSAAARPSPSC